MSGNKIIAAIAVSLTSCSASDVGQGVPECDAFEERAKRPVFYGTETARTMPPTLQTIQQANECIVASSMGEENGAALLHDYFDSADISGGVVIVVKFDSSSFAGLAITADETGIIRKVQTYGGSASTQ